MSTQRGQSADDTGITSVTDGSQCRGPPNTTMPEIRSLCTGVDEAQNHNSLDLELGRARSTSPDSTTRSRKLSSMRENSECGSDGAGSVKGRNESVRSRTLSGEAITGDIANDIVRKSSF